MDKLVVHEMRGYRIVLNRTSAKRISVESAINAGFIHETKDTSGINHLLEHIMTEAWKSCGSSCSQYWADRGVSMNASTDATQMMYYVKGLKEDLPQMVAYITAITDHPVFRKSSIEKEKQAVTDELLTVGSDPWSKLDTVFNHLFYTNGLEFKDDWKLQIKNLKHLTLADLKRAYETQFNSANVVFLVSGDFSPPAVLHLFDHALQQKPHGTRGEASGFTFAHAIVHVKDASETSRLQLSMPSHNNEISVLTTLAVYVLGDVLFYHLRTKHQLVYGIHVTAGTSTCGTRLDFAADVRPQNIKATLRIIWAQLHQLLRHVPDKALASAKKRYHVREYTRVPDVEFYSVQFLTNPNRVVTRAEQRNIVDRCTAADLRDAFASLFQFDNFVCVYQGNRDVHLQLDDFKASRGTRKR